MNIYKAALELGVEIDNHESDLYIPVTTETRNLVHMYEYRQNVTVFTSQIDGKPWFDIPFAYEPWWQNAANQVSRWAHDHIQVIHVTDK